MEAQLLLGAHLLQHGALVGAGLEVALVAGQLHPRIALLLVRLEERRPLHDVAQLPPARRLLREFRWGIKQTR